MAVRYRRYWSGRVRVGGWERLVFGGRGCRFGLVVLGEGGAGRRGFVGAVGVGGVFEGVRRVVLV